MILIFSVRESGKFQGKIKNQMYELTDFKKAKEMNYNGT